MYTFRALYSCVVFVFYCRTSTTLHVHDRQAYYVESRLIEFFSNKQSTKLVINQYFFYDEICMNYVQVLRKCTQTNRRIKRNVYKTSRDNRVRKSYANHIIYRYIYMDEHLSSQEDT